MDIASVVGWFKSNPVTDVAIVAWVVANVAPRPRPDQVESRAAQIFWMVLDRICVLTAGRVPGTLKWILVPSPVPVESDVPTRPDVPAVSNDPPPNPKGDSP